MTTDLAAPKTETPAQMPATPASSGDAASLDAVIEQVFGPQDTPQNDATGGKPEPAANDATPPKKADEAPKDEKIAQRLVAAKRAEEKAARERAELKSQKDAQEKRQADLDAREKRIKVIEEDPLRFFEEFKKDPKEFLERLAGEYKPENVAVKKATAVEQELADLKKQIAERDAAAKRQAEQAQNTAAWREASAQFISHIGEHHEKYPNLVQEFSEDEATRLAYSALNEIVGHSAEGRPIRRVDAYHAEHGAYPDDDVIAEYLDSIAKTRIEARTKSAWRQRGQAAEPARQASTGDPKPVPTGRGTSPRTLTSREASQRIAPPARKGGLVWTAADQVEADEAALRIIEEAMRRTG